MKKVFVLMVLLTGCTKTEIVDKPIEQPSVVITEDVSAAIDTLMEEASEVSNVKGITVSINEKITHEEYFNYGNVDQVQNAFSVTKSVMSILVGIAIEQGFIESVDQSIGDFLDLSSYGNKEELETVQIKHLLSMSAGLVWNSNDLSSEMIALRRSRDPLGFVLQREMGYTPGTRFNYSDGASHMMSLILSEATEQTAYDFAKEYLFDPLDIKTTTWGEDYEGNNIGGCDLHLTNRDMNKIGHLVLHDGMYEGVQIVSKEWLEQSTSKQIRVGSYLEYGYYWWIHQYRGETVLSAKGWGGQLIMIVPEKNIVITTLTNGWVSDESATRQFDEMEEIVFRILDELL